MNIPWQELIIQVWRCMAQCFVTIYLLGNSLWSQALVQHDNIFYFWKAILILVHDIFFLQLSHGGREFNHFFPGTSVPAISNSCCGAPDVIAAMRRPPFFFRCFQHKCPVGLGYDQVVIRARMVMVSPACRSTVRQATCAHLLVRYRSGPWCRSSFFYEEPIGF